MPALIERHKMSLAMWAALKSHIMKQREKKKQGKSHIKFFKCRTFSIFNPLVTYEKSYQVTISKS